MARKVAQHLFTALGVLLLAAALGLSLAAALQDRHAEQRSHETAQAIEQEIAAVSAQAKDSEPESAAAGNVPYYVIDPDMEMPTIRMNGNDYIGVLSLPTIERELPIISTLSMPALQLAPCRYEGSLYSGDLIIAAHNYDSHFGQIKNLAIGDPVHFTDAEGNQFHYEVIEIEQLAGTAVSEMSAGDWDLTLFTCTLGGANRVTVRCAEKQE